MSWHHSDLASIVTVLESGSRPKGGASTESGEIPSLGGENILRNGGITLDGVKRVSREFYEMMTKGHLVDGDVLINKDGAQTGKVGLYRNQNGTPSCINEHLFLIRGDVDYYDFKSNIETKEQIRDHLGNVDQSIINQFERWWDKYRVSLHEIDAQEKQSEEVMYDYLKELGYE